MKNSKDLRELIDEQIRLGNATEGKKVAGELILSQFAGHKPQKGRSKEAREHARSEAKKRQALFDKVCERHGLPIPDHEYQFHPDRKWRFDFLFEGWLAVEKVGGVWQQGHHSRGQSQIDDMEKFNEAVILGYAVLQFTPEQLESGAAFAVIRRALGAREEQP